MAKVTHLEVTDCFVLEGARYHDERGFFTELFNETKTKDISEKLKPCKQVSLSQSKANVLRGIHTSQYSKLVACLSGRLIDYVIDLREDSPTYLKWVSVELDPQNGKQLYVPPGCGHMFVALEDNTLMCYIQSGTFNPPFEMEVNFADPQIGIKLPNDDISIYTISEKDRNSPMLAEAQAAYKARHTAKQ
jgi:dTDP-4-dehydrorhamnose 3,5-epimerase